MLRGHGQQHVQLGVGPHAQHRVADADGAVGHERGHAGGDLLGGADGMAGMMCDVDIASCDVCRMYLGPQGPQGGGLVLREVLEGSQPGVDQDHLPGVRACMCTILV